MTNKERFLELVSKEETKTFEQLKSLADKIRNESKSKESSLKTLQDAGILGDDGNFTEPYKRIEQWAKKNQ